MTKIIASKFSTLVFGLVFLLATTLLAGSFVESAYAASSCGAPGDGQVKTAIDLGCQQRGNPIMDMLFAFIRLLSAGVGVVIIGSIVVAGIQYSTARSDPATTAKAVGRIRSSLGALLIFIFAYAILNYVIPGQFLK